MKKCEYHLTCDNCDEDIYGNTTLDLTEYESDNEYLIDIDMIGGFELKCEKCGHTYYIPDLRDYIEDVTSEVEEENEDDEE